MKLDILKIMSYCFVYIYLFAFSILTLIEFSL